MIGETVQYCELLGKPGKGSMGLDSKTENIHLDHAEAW